MNTVSIQGRTRQPGSKDNRTLRNAGEVPCVMYGNGGSIHFSVPLIAFKDLLYRAGLRTAEISLDGKTHKAIIKESQFDPVTDRLLHVDFLELNEAKPIRAEIPLRTKGRAKGELEGGILYVNVPRLRVKGKPSRLVEFIEVDVSDMAMNDSIRVSDLKAMHPELEIHHPDTVSVISVETSRAARAAAAEEAAAAAAKAAAEAAVAAPVVEGEKKAEVPGAEVPAKEPAEAKKAETKKEG